MASDWIESDSYAINSDGYPTRPLGLALLDSTPQTGTVGIALLDGPRDTFSRTTVSEDLFIPNVAPSAPLTPGLGYALGAGRRIRRGVDTQIGASAGVSLWGGEQYSELERAIEDVFSGGVDFDNTGELVRPFVGADEATDILPRTQASLPVWQEQDVPPPTPVFETPAKTEGGIRTAPVTRRELREQRKAANSARTVAARKLAKGGVLAVTMFGVVASNAPQALHDRLFPSGAATELTTAPGAESLALGASSALVGTDVSMRRQSLIEDALRQRLVKEQTGLTVTEAGQDAATAVVAAAKAQSAVDATTAKAERARAEAAAQSNPRAMAKLMVLDRGWSSTQFVCLDKLWTKESGWRWNADNPTSSAYGIPQSLPGSKMSSAGADWRTNPRTQITWGLGYIASRYGTPCSAWSHSVSHNWY